MRSTIVIETDRRIPAPILAIAVNPEKPRTLQRLLGHKEAKAAFFYRAKGPDGSPFAGPTISNGHWLLTRPNGTKAAKAWDKLLEKGRKIAGVKNGEDFGYRDGWNECDVPNFEAITEDCDYEVSVLDNELRFYFSDGDYRTVPFEVQVMPRNGNGKSAWESRTGEPVKFDLRYLGPLLGHFTVLLGPYSFSFAQLVEGENVVGIIAPLRP